jgi:NADH-quinone oxidoreductase subunit L
MVGALAYAWLLPVVPLAAFVVILASGRRIPRLWAAGLSIAAMAFVFAGSVAILVATAGGARFTGSIPWMSVGEFEASVGILIDPLAAVMLIVVSFVSLLVQVYSLGYMHDEERLRWYYGAISLFSASMLGVVVADGWLLMYMCWELMGLSSYLLIGFWYEQPEAAAAAKKAFLVTRLGDVGFGLALAAIWWGAGSLQFAPVLEAVESGHFAGPALTAAALLLFCGAMGKSAQFPLHVWLPDAMAGPTPGSALIHAATMVAAGVYLVARSYPLFEASPVALTTVALVGTITAVMAALIALAMQDIKKVLAYSTISQLGYMMLALGVGSWVAAIFHLMTHAFFKALLFLAAGSVIHATHTQDLREMGGLWRKMPWTTATWVLGALSLAGIPPLAGFWSKDEILVAVLHSGKTSLLVAGLLTAMLTAFYMGRATLLAFFVKPKPESDAHTHAHESPWVMTVPLAVLATLAVTAGVVGSPVGGYAFGGFLGEHAAEGLNVILMGVAVAVALAGIVLAWSMYIRRYFTPDSYLETAAVKWTLPHKFWIDEAYQLAFVGPLMWLASLSDTADKAVVDGAVRGVGWLAFVASRILVIFDKYVVDAAVNGLGGAIMATGRQARRIQTGNVQTYLLLLFLAILVLVLLFAGAR